MLLLIDNYDSFVHNLARYLRRLGQETVVLRNDVADVAEVERLRPAALVLSPGPCAPADAGNSLTLVRELHGELPMLGVCLGHQVIAAALGGSVVRAPRPVHGRHSRVRHDGRGVFDGLSQPLTACRYHSLAVDGDSLPAELEVSAWADDDGCLMAVRHRRLPLVGLQFHPESVLTPDGYRLLANFLRLAGLPATPAPDLYDERPPEPADAAEADSPPPDSPPIPF